MFDERERKLLRAFSDVVRFEIDALHDRYETLKLKEHALHRALVRKGVLTIEEWNSAVTEASAEIAIQLGCPRARRSISPAGPPCAHQDAQLAGGGAMIAAIYPRNHTDRK